MPSKNLKLPQRLANIILHVVIIGFFVCCFFFTWGAFLEKIIMQNEINYVCKSVVNELTVLAPSAAQALKTIITGVVLPDMTAADAASVAENKKLSKLAFTVMGSLFAGGLVIALGIILKFNVPIFEILAFNGTGLFIVALTYFVFSTAFIANYRSADPNTVKLELLNHFFPTIA